MNSWQGATDRDRRMFATISLVFNNHPALLDFFFEKKRPRIRLAGVEMRRAAAVFSGGEQILIRVALDMWSGSGNAKIWQMLETLDDSNLHNCLRALSFLRGLDSAN